jgi:hypothetical protein
VTATIVATVAPHACGICDGPLTWAGREGPYDAWHCATCEWDHVSKGCCDGTLGWIGDLLPETGPMPPRRVLMRDRSLPHQIIISIEGHGQRLTVGCNCGSLHRAITDAVEARDAYRAHLTREGIDPDD